MSCCHFVIILCCVAWRFSGSHRIPRVVVEELGTLPCLIHRAQDKFHLLPRLLVSLNFVLCACFCLFAVSGDPQAVYLCVASQGFLNVGQTQHKTYERQVTSDVNHLSPQQAFTSLICFVDTLRWSLLVSLLTKTCGALPVTASAALSPEAPQPPQ